MSISQAGIAKITLYENKGFTFLYDSEGNIILSSISNTGDTLEFVTEDNSIKLSNKIEPAGNNTILNDYTLMLVLDGLEQTTFDKIEKFRSSIYGWIPVIEFMDNQTKLINVPFFEKVDSVDTQVSHTFNIEMKPQVFTFHRLENVVDKSVDGLLDFDGVDDDVVYSGVPDITGSKTITLEAYFANVSGDESAMMALNIQDNTSDFLGLYFINESGTPFIYLEINDSATGEYAFELNESLLGQFLEIIIIKTTGTVTSFSVNGNIITASNRSGGYAAGNGFIIGNDNDDFSNSSLSAWLWNITIQGVFNAPGQPVGNTTGAWDDTVGSLTATVNGSPSTIDLP